MLCQKYDISLQPIQKRDMWYVKIIYVNYNILLTDCNVELFTFAGNCIRGFKHMTYYCFFVNSAFLLPFCETLAFVCVQLDTGQELFQLILSQKVCHHLVRDKGGGVQVKR